MATPGGIGNGGGGSSAVRNAERSSLEIKDLVRKLHPTSGNHKDRIRRLNKFRNYVQPDNNGGTPEFYDDDIPLLFLGAETPAIYLDDETAQDDLPTRKLYYGLLFSAGMKSDNSTGSLKRSARHAMNLLKWLLLDWKDHSSNGADAATQQSSPDPPLNLFARAFCSLSVSAYRAMQLNIHVTGDDRGGAKEDSCTVIVLILCHHLSETGETTQPVLLEELVTTPVAQQAYDLWMARSNVVTPRQQELITKNTLIRQEEIAMLQRQEAVLLKAGVVVGGGGAGGGGAAGDDDVVEDSDHDDEDHHHGDDDDVADHHVGGGGADKEEDSDSEIDELDVMAAMRKRQRTIRKELLLHSRSGSASVRNLLPAGVAAVRWVDSQLAREQAVRVRAAAAAAAAATTSTTTSAATLHSNTVRDSANAAHELQVREDEKAKSLGKDPLGILGLRSRKSASQSGSSDDDDGQALFDLRQLENTQAEHMERALHETAEELQKAETVGNEELVKKATLSKESLEHLMETLGGLEAMENYNSKASLLPTRSNFHPLLFLTLLHRKTAYKELIDSMFRLSSKTENQAEQLQNLVRDNFPLFVRCAEGFEEFRTNSETEVGLGVSERIEKLEAIAESAAYQAAKSFKPLLDNTSEIRKVQSSLAVLQRVAPILQVPALMRQHIENRRYSQALKTYRRCLVIDESCNISLLTHVKLQADACVRDARRDLENRITLDKVSLDDILNGIRDLSELLELDVPTLDRPQKSKDAKSNEMDTLQDRGVYTIGSTTVNIRDHPPALACLLLQSAHFALASQTLVNKAEDAAQRIFAGESLTSVQTKETSIPVKESKDGDSKESGSSGLQVGQPGVSGNQWKYDVLDARVLSTIQAVDIARVWFPRLVRVGKAAREEEKRRVARIGGRSRNTKENHLTTFEVFSVNIVPSLSRLVEHASFCSLGSSNRTGAKYLDMTFGQNADDKLQTLLRSPLPPSQSTKVGKELASLVAFLDECSIGVNDLRPDHVFLKVYPLDASKTLGNSAVVTIEKRRCIYAFDVCSRACSNRASGNGKFDADSLVNCMQNLSEQLTRPEECSNEVEKGCELVVRRCCEGLASFVRDRGDDARLSAVAECADIMSDRLGEITLQVSTLSPNSKAVQDAIVEDILGLESAMFDEYLESIHQHVANSVRVGWLDKDVSDGSIDDGDMSQPATFPSYLSASLLAIVRCRAQVEQALGDRIRGTDGLSYQHLSMATVSSGVIEGVCGEVMKRKLTLKVRQADRLANELEFLKNTLKKFLDEETMALLASSLHMVSTKAGRSRDYQGDGPDGLAALEELERLGRVYVLCLGD